MPNLTFVARTSLRVRAAILTLFFVTMLGIAGDLCGQEGRDEELPSSWQLDAQLNDVCFVDRQHGWAVGAQGLILKTVDGGRNWQKRTVGPVIPIDEMSLSKKLQNLRQLEEINQTKPPQFRFESVHFVDQNTGWAAGGYATPYVERSHGIVLKTVDGGSTWREIRGQLLPHLSQIKFRDAKNGWAVGYSSNLYQTGVYYTSDGGGSWSGASSEIGPHWKTGVAHRNGFLTIDTTGRIFRVNETDREPSVILDRAATRMNAVKMLDAKTGWAVGDRGAILKTEDGGTSWSRPTFKTPDGRLLSEQPLFNQLRGMDLLSLAIVENRIWAVGNPGNVFVAVDLAGQTVTLHQSGGQLPVRSISFVDSQTGCAVGSMGQIFMTDDAGQSWRLVRTGNKSDGTATPVETGQRMAMLAIGRKPADLPLELLAKYSCEENALTATVTFESGQKGLGTPDPEQRFSLAERTNQAIERLGGSLNLNLNTDSIAGLEPEEHLIGRLVRTIRMTQPSVVAACFDSGSPADSLRDETMLMKAIKAAGQKFAFPEQLEMGLQVWRVQRVAFADRNGRMKISSRVLLPRTGLLMEDKLAVSRGLLEMSLRGFESRNFRVQEVGFSSRAETGDLFSGLNQRGQWVPVRNTRTRGTGNLAAIKQASGKQKQMQQLMEWSITTPQQLLEWQRAVTRWSLGMQPYVAGVWLSDLAQQYLESGRPEMTAETLELLATQFSHHPLASASIMWLVQYYASGEYGQMAVVTESKLEKIRTVSNTRDTGRTIKITDGGAEHTVWVPNAAFQNGNKTEQAAATEVTPEALRKFRLQRASKWLERLRQRDPDWAHGTELRYFESQIVRQLSGSIVAENLFEQVVRRRDDNLALARAAGRELFLAKKSALIKANGLDAEQAVKVFENSGERAFDFVCKSGQRPKLDGRLNDEVWIAATPFKVQRTVANGFRKSEAPDVVLMAHDDQLFYLAAKCQKIRGQIYSTEKSNRTRDPDLKQQDRIEFRIDVDRDYRSTFSFTVDHRGWCAEKCGPCVEWNPDWYVARTVNENDWTVEVAIPKSTLTATDEAFWAVNFSRFSNQDTAVWSEVMGGISKPDWTQQLNPRVADFGLMHLR